VIHRASSFGKRGHGRAWLKESYSGLLPLIQFGVPLLCPQAKHKLGQSPLKSRSDLAENYKSDEKGSGVGFDVLQYSVKLAFVSRL
jgi:hypothetical protein